MKVIHVTWAPEKYGVGTFLHNLIRCQIKNFKNLQVAVAFHSDGPNLEKYTRLGIPVYNLCQLSARNIKLVYMFMKIFRHYDIVNLHGASPYAFVAAILTRKKIIYTFHGALGLRKFWGIPVTKVFMKYVFAIVSDFFTFASAASYKHFAENFNIQLDEKKHQIFPYGLNIELVKPGTEKSQVRKQAGWENKFLIGTAARMVPVKRPDLLIRAFSKLKLRDHCHLLLMGTGTQQYEAYLRRLAAELKLGEQISFLGYRSDALDVINALDVFVLSSRREPFGLALLEAMALGVPSIVMKDGGGVIDIIGNSGLVAENEDDLAAKIEAFRSTLDLREQKAQLAKKRSEQFDISSTACHLISIYQHLMIRRDVISASLPSVAVQLQTLSSYSEGQRQ